MMAVAILCATALTACGGDDSAPGATPTPTPPSVANRAPVFSSAGTATTAENVEGPFYQATATDPDSDSISFSLTGPDAGQFGISPAGQLSFLNPPNYDLPADADRDNVYQIQISASDGKTPSTMGLAVTVTNDKEGVAVRRIATGFVNPVAIAPVSETAMVVAEKAGAIYLLDLQTGTRTLLIQIGEGQPVQMLALAPGASFATDRTFYAMYITANKTLLVDWFLRNPAGPIVRSNFASIVAASAPQYAGGGWLGFDAQGNLLAAIGDGGGKAQDDASALGKLLRLRRNPDPYAGAAPVFFIVSTVAKGLHRPNGGSEVDGGLLIADRGQDFAEELDLFVTGSDVRNFGWPFKEGTRTAQAGAPAGLVDPVLEYYRSDGRHTGQAIVGGARGPAAVISLRERYVFGDESGAIFTVPIASLAAGTTLTSEVMELRTEDFTPDQGAIDHPVLFKAGANGTFYIADEDGEIFLVAG